MNESLTASIRERYQHTLAQIAEAAAGCGRAPEAVRLVVVSKSQPLQVVQAAVSAGISTFGENYAEEAVKKINDLGKTTLEWHMIGHVQSRKAELVAANFAMLHSLDSLKLAGRLERFCSELNRTLPVLLECNVSGEASKFGFPAWQEGHWSDLEHEIEQILAFPHLGVCGLMTMPPLFTNPECTRPYFQRLCRLQEFLGKQFPMARSPPFIEAVCLM
ncbi:MAG: YggS family pyridoxal phosphate-dependent enzyme [Anaerolineales bacterium]